MWVLGRAYITSGLMMSKCQCYTNTVIYDTVISFANTRSGLNIHNASSTIIPQVKPNTTEEETHVSSYTVEALSLGSRLLVIITTVCDICVSENLLVVNLSYVKCY